MSGQAGVRTTCPYCGVGCGVIASPQPDGSVAIAGDPEHPANFGRLCSKGLALGETLGLDGRLLEPRIGGRRAEWDEALDLVARKFSEAIRDHGPDSVAFYVSGQLLNEDYYLANKLMKGYIGSANIDTNSRLCMASSVAGHRRAFGSDTVPGCYEDLDLADLVVLAGSNLAWCHPVLFQRLMAARERRGTRIIVIDPRRTASAEQADLHLALRPDMDTALFAGLLRHLLDTAKADAGYARHLQGLEAVDPAGLPDNDEVALRTGLSSAEVLRFFEEFGATEKVVTVYSQGVNQSVRGTDKVNAILNCHLVTGRIGKPGMGPFSVTGQPNAMGGREVGGLANMLAAHMDIEDAAARERVQRFWSSPTIAARQGLKAVDLFRAISEHKIKALWIMGTNPAVSLPAADGAVAALAACPFVVVSDVVAETDTTALADVLLPAAAWGEKDGTVSNSERRMSRQRAFLPLPGVARPDWAIIADVARRMGFAGFTQGGPAEVFAEHAALSGFENNGMRDFDISAHAAIGAKAYDGLAPFQWPQPAGATPAIKRFFADGGFYTPGRKARIVVTPLPDIPEGTRLGSCINTGRIRDQWHTMTRTGGVPRLMGQFGEPFCDIHPDDADALGLGTARLVTLRQGDTEVILRARITDSQQRGSVFVPMHWSNRFAARARINTLVPARVDPISGQPGFKASRGQISVFEPLWHAYAVTVARPCPDGLDYWALSPVAGGFALECAGLQPVEDWQGRARELTACVPDAEWIAVFDGAAGISRLAAFAGSRLVAAVFVSPEPVEVSRAFLTSALGSDLPGAQRFRILAGRNSAGEADDGAQICACQGVGIDRIRREIAAGADSVDRVGAACGAGTGCGSCRSDIRRLIASEHAQAVAARTA